MTSTTRNCVYWLTWPAGMSSERNSPGDRWLLNGKTLGSPTLSYTVKSWLWKDGSIDVRSAWEWSVKNICCFDSFGSQQQQQSSSDVFSFLFVFENGNCSSDWRVRLVLIGQVSGAFHTVVAHAHLSTHTDVHRKQGTCETLRKHPRRLVNLVVSRGNVSRFPRSIRCCKDSLEQGQQKWFP